MTAEWREIWSQCGKTPIDGRFLLPAAFLLVVAGWHGSALAESGGKSSGDVQTLTVDAAVERSVERSNFVEQHEASVAGAEASRRDVTRVPNPAFLYDREQWWQEGDVFAQDWFMLEQEFELPGVRTARRESADAKVDAARHQRSRAERELRVEIRQSFYEILALQRRCERASAWVRRLEEVREIVKDRAGQGELSAGDEARIEADYETALAEFESTRAEVERRRASFLQRVGVDGDHSSWKLDGSLKGPKVDLTEQQAVERLERRADLEALEARAEAAGARATTARRSWMSSVGVHGGYIRVSEPGVVAHGFAVGVGVPLPIFDRNRGAVEEAAAERRGIESRLALRRRELAGEVRGLVRSARKRREAAARFRKRGVAAARDLVEKAESAYRSDEASLFELLDAERSLFEAEQKLVDLRERATVTELDLAATIGPPANDEKP